MIIVKTRIWRILYYLLKKNALVTASELAQFVDVSTRTIKSDMKEVKELAMASGCEIVAEKANGYYAKVVNPDLYQPMKSILVMNFSENEFTVGMDNRANDVTRHLLMQNEWITEETLADSLFISLSTLKLEMKAVKDILNGFNLKLLIRPNYGMIVEGLEINKRFCMLELLIKHHHNAISLVNYPDFEAMFVIDEYPLAQIRKVYLRILRKSGLHVIDSNSHRLLRYLALMYKRNLLGYYVEIDEEIKAQCKLLKEYEFSKNVIETLNTEFNLPLQSDDEICGLTVLVLFWNDINDHKQIKQLYGNKIYKLATSYTSAVFDFIEQKWKLSLPRTNFNCSLLDALFVPYAFRTLFKQIGYRKYLGRMITSNDIAVSPLCLSFASCAMENLVIQYDVQTNNYLIFELATRLHHILQQIEFPYQKRNLLICMRNGVDSGYVTRQVLYDTFGKDRFGDIKFLEFYEIRGVDQSKYDYCLLNSDIYYYQNYDVPAIVCNTIPTLSQREDIRQKIIQEGYNYEGILKSLNFDEELKVNDITAGCRKEFLKMICYRFGIFTKEYESPFDNFDDLFVFEDTVTIILQREVLGKSLFEINRMTKGCNWCGKTVNYVLLISVDLTNNLIGAHFLQVLIYTIITDTCFVDKLTTKSNYGVILEHLKKVQTRL